MNNNEILVCGDIHGEWGPLNKLISRYKPEIILQCGDFGWWPKLHNTELIKTGRRWKKWNQYGLKNGDTKIYFCDGNHEDHWDLKEYDGMKEIMPNVFYMPRGSVLELPDSRKVLFMGGASSIDKDRRIVGHDWFPEEEINQKDLYDLTNDEINIIISHTCPTEFRKGAEFCEFKHKDWSNEALSFLLEKYSPELWYFGHFHYYDISKYLNTKWYCLNTIGGSYGWKRLDEI